MYGIFTKDRTDKIESLYSENAGFDANDPDWLYPYPSEGYGYASLTKHVSVMRGLGHSDRFRSLILRDDRGRQITEVELEPSKENSNAIRPTSRWNDR